MENKWLDKSSVEIENLLVTDTSDLTEDQINLLKFSTTADQGVPYFKIKHFIGNAQITPYAKYKQLLLELRAREEVLENFLMNTAKQEAQVEVLREEYEKETSPAKRKLKEFELITNKNDLIKIKRRLAQAYEERKRFITAIEEMYASGEAYLPDGTDMAEAIRNPELGEKLEREHWIARLGKQTALDLISMGRLGTGNMDAIAMLSENDAVETLKVAVDWSARVQNALGSIEKEKLAELSQREFTIELLEKNTKLELE